MDLGDLRHAGLQRAPRIVQQAAVLDKQRQVPPIVDALHPTDAIAAAGEFIRPDRREGDAGALFHFGAENVHPDALQRVFGFGVLAIGAVAPVALRGHHGLRDRQRMFERNVAELAGPRA